MGFNSGFKGLKSELIAKKHIKLILTSVSAVTGCSKAALTCCWKNLGTKQTMTHTTESFQYTNGEVKPYYLHLGTNWRWQDHASSYNSNTLTNQMQQFYKFITWGFVSFNMLRAPTRPSSGAYKCINSLWFYLGAWW